ncbi:hypothetical protein [Streptomyces sp. WAC07061]|uniref:hypothetical protein n=1 Tax=Streptomyces sp. WAC07061 TaxID=2487410 RepID=UPI0021AF42F1|nr:hypothetical protein [Streptomyces sp. WAC07061]
MSAEGDRKARRAKLTLAGLAVAAAVLLAGGGYGAAVLLDDDGGPGAPTAGAPAPGAPAKGPSAGPSASGAELSKTPETGPKLKLFKPTGHANGVATGFRHSGVDAVSAAVYWWEEYAWLDDQKARQQLEAVVSPDAPGYVDQQVSEVRKLREQAGLPPSGGTPSAISFTTSVRAVRYYALPVEGEKDGDVIEVWMTYDRYATGPDGKPDTNPLKGELTSVVLRWQNGMWRITNQPGYVKNSSHPVSYFPESPYAWRDGWRQVQRAG